MFKNIQSPTLRSLHNAALFDTCLCLQINNQLKTLWFISTFIDKFNLSIVNYQQISSAIDLSTTLSMIDMLRPANNYETVSDSAECYAGLLVHFESSPACI